MKENHREDIKASIISHLLIKFRCRERINDITLKIDKEAKIIDLTSQERSKLVLQAKKEFAGGIYENR